MILPNLIFSFIPLQDTILSFLDFLKYEFHINLSITYLSFFWCLYLNPSLSCRKYQQSIKQDYSIINNCFFWNHLLCYIIFYIYSYHSIFNKSLSFTSIFWIYFAFIFFLIRIILCLFRFFEYIPSYLHEPLKFIIDKGFLLFLLIFIIVSRETFYKIKLFYLVKF